jgi:hypothetical protein
MPLSASPASNFNSSPRITCAPSIFEDKTASWVSPPSGVIRSRASPATFRREELKNPAIRSYRRASYNWVAENPSRDCDVRSSDGSYFVSVSKSQMAETAYSTSK